MKELLTLEKKGDAKALAPYLQSLVLPGARNWFQSVFGEQIGDALAGSYERIGMELPMSFPDTLASMVKQKVGDPSATEFTDSCNPRASPQEYPILVLRQNSRPLYVIRFYKGYNVLTIRYFAYVQGAFRYLGNFQVAGSWPIGQTESQSKRKEHEPQRIRVGGDVMAARLVRQVTPEYPSEARQAGIQGTVILHALIGKDGSLREIRLLQGQCWLAEAAIKAVKQWRYTPYLLKGEPVEVDTTIQAIFNMR